MRIYTNGRSTGISMGPIGWLIFGPILLVFYLFAGFIKMVTR